MTRALIEFSRIILQPGYIPATKTSGRHRLVLRSTTRPCTENTSEVATPELLAVCGWVEVIASLAHGGYPCTTNPHEYFTTYVHRSLIC